MYISNIGLDEPQRLAVMAQLQARLSDALDLAAQLKQAHWNVKGANFHQLHLLFDTIFVATEAHVDLLAERIVTLGGTADGRVQTTTRATSLAVYPIDAKLGEQHASAIGRSLADFAASVRVDIDIAAEKGDAGTADLFTEISRGVDKHLWFIEAHLHS